MPISPELIYRILLYDPISDTLMGILWLPVESTMVFKILLLVSKCIHNIHSEYLVSKLKLKRYNCVPVDYLKLETPKS